MYICRVFCSSTKHKALAFRKQKLLKFLTSYYFVLRKSNHALALKAFFLEPVISLKARAKNVFSQSAHLFTLSITNQNLQKTIENEEKRTVHPGGKQRPNHRPFAVEKTTLTTNRCCKWYFTFPRRFLHFQK